MAKPSSGKRPAAGRKAPADRLREALQKTTKTALVDVIMEIAESDRAVRRELETRFKVDSPPDELLAATRVAIADATAFDQRAINSNFDYDYGAYETIEKNLRRLIDKGHLEDAMTLSLELMRCGSCQVEMSDEGMMTEDIEKCLRVVIQAVEKSDMSSAKIARWRTAMRQSDRVGFICHSELGQS